MEPLTPDDIEALKPRKGALVLLIPVFLVFLVLGVYIVTFVVAVQGRAADGERVTLTWSACPEAQEVIARRVEAIGLGDPVFATIDGGFTLTATLPSDPQVAMGIPATLTEPGVLQAMAGDTVIFDNSDILSGSIRQDLTLIPWTVLRIDDDAVQRLGEAVMAERRGEVDYVLDGRKIARVSNLKGYGPEVEFTAEDASTDLERMMKTARRTVVIGSGPLPCPVQQR